MITVSLCMIVKNEEKVLERCLDSIADLVDEIIIVDTGSWDRTKEIAARYTEHVLDFRWTEDFSAARNYVFSMATMEYIYSADADEVLSEENRERFRLLKETLLPEIEIVQMKYSNQLRFGTVYNFDEEYRPKLFKRKRDFVWEDPVHETVRLMPVIYDSDIVIEHMPQESHGKRDLACFYKHCRQGLRLSKRLHGLYARELMLVGDEEDFRQAREFFTASAGDAYRDGEELAQACCVVARAARLAGRGYGEFLQIHFQGDCGGGLLGDLLRDGAFLRRRGRLGRGCRMVLQCSLRDPSHPEHSGRRKGRAGGLDSVL